MLDHSQNGEQRVILDFFGATPGVFIDCGANDGITLSNTHALALKGWHGVCVEPADIAYGKLCRLYANNHRIVPVKAAITEGDGEINFWDSGTHLKKGDTSLLSTTRPEEMARWAKSGEQFTKTRVRGITIATLLAETGIQRVDFISIDCEGVDLSVLGQFDLAGLGVRMLCVESNSVNDQAFVRYAAGHGMRLEKKNFENLIFVRS